MIKFALCTKEEDMHFLTSFIKLIFPSSCNHIKLTATLCQLQLLAGVTVNKIVCLFARKTMHVSVAAAMHFFALNALLFCTYH